MAYGAPLIRFIAAVIAERPKMGKLADDLIASCKLVLFARYGQESADGD
ncbi:MAG: hypothetical protein ABJ057_02865 [Erythrobacter sp.]